MADKLKSLDNLMKDYLLSTKQQAAEYSRDARIKASDPGYLDQASTRQRNVYAEQGAHFDDQLLVDKGRDLGEHLQDMSAGLIGTMGAIGNTAVLGVAAAGDALGNITGTNENWDATQAALQQMNNTSEYWNSLKSEKSQGFQRISQYRQERALEQLNAESRAKTGHDAGWADRFATSFGSAVGSYIDNPDQILTEGVAQLPYILTGGLAKGITTGTKLANPLIGAMIKKGMSREAATKMVEMGIVGVSQGAIEGSDAASQAYQRVMDSTDTFGPGQEAERESAALAAAGKAFAIAGTTSAITGTLASKWELEPFKAMGHNVLTRTGDNIIKALQEGIQETIESGTSQFASNYTGNQVLQGKDLVALDEGVGAAAGTGFVVGMGSTAVTNPRSAIDAAVAPLVLAGKPFSYMADRAAKAERTADMAAASTAADNIVATATTPALAAAMQAGVQQPSQSVNTPVEDVVLPAEINTSSQIGLFATGMQYLRGKDLNSEDAVGAFHTLGAVLAAANNIAAQRDAAAQDAADESLSPADRELAQKNLEKFNEIMDSDRLDKLVAELPMENIEDEMETLRKNPESFAAVIAHIAARNPLKMTPKLIDTALESKTLSKPLRESLKLAQELKEAEAELKGDLKPDSAGVARSMMHTGFPGSTENDSVSGYISKITTAFDAGETVDAQVYFNRLAKFAAFEQGRAAAYEAAKKQMASDPDSKQVNLEGYFQLGDDGKLDRTKPQFVNKKSLDLVQIVRKDADTIQKMADAISKRTGLKVMAAAPETTPAAKPETTPALTVAETKPTLAEEKRAKWRAEVAEKAAATAKSTALTKAKKDRYAQEKADRAAAKAEDTNELKGISDEALNQETKDIAAAIGRRRNSNTAKAVEQDIRYNNLVREQARRMKQGAKPATAAPVAATPTVDPDASRVTEAQAKRLTDEGIQIRLDNIEKKTIQERSKADDATWAVLNAEMEIRKAADTVEDGAADETKSQDVVLTGTSPYLAKDQAKSDQANKFIGRGSEKSSTAKYAKAWGENANTGTYTRNDVVFVSAEGQRLGRKGINKDELSKAIAAGVTFITDIAADRNRDYNIGEREVAAFLESKGYEETAPGKWKTKNAETSEPSKNHFTDLQASYPVVEGATVAEQSDAKNHLTQSFTTSQEPGLLTKLPETAEDLVTDLQVVGEDASTVAKIFGFKSRIVGRLQTGLQAQFPKSKLAAMLNGQNFWKEANGHSLYATSWNKDGIAYDSVIAEVMAWTGVQQLLDMVVPVKWSAEKEAGFVKTYGENILPLLRNGWVPMPEQVHHIARRLQRNLELTAVDNTVSKEYTDGAMLSLAGDVMGILLGDKDTKGSFLVQRVPMQSGPLVNWIKVDDSNEGPHTSDTLFDSARALEGFFPERSASAAAVIGEMPTKVKTRYRDSLQKVGKEQKKALLKMSQAWFKLSPLMSNMWDALPNEALLRLVGYNPPTDKPVTYAEIEREGAANTIRTDLKVIQTHMKAVRTYASEKDVDPSSVNSYFEHEMVVNGRAMTLGTSPQSSKLYRVMFPNVQRMIDPSKDNKRFMMAVAQGFGIKMDKQPVATSLAELEEMLAKPEIQAALAAAGRFSEKNMSSLEDDLKAFENSGVEMTPEALSAFIHMAEYQKDKPFNSSLAFEIDGLTDGPINLMMFMGLKGGVAEMEHWLGLGGLWFGEQKIAVQDKLKDLAAKFGGPRDLYEIIAASASKINSDQADRILASVPAYQQKDTRQMLRAILHLMTVAGFNKADLSKLIVDHTRSLTKKPTQAAGYQQGDYSIISDMAKTMLVKLSQLMDEGKLDDTDLEMIDVMLGKKLVYSKTKKQFFLIEQPEEFSDFQWNGQELNKTQFNGLMSNLINFGGKGLAEATLTTIGYQRARMAEAVSLINAHINFAQVKLKEAYKAKQASEVEAGNLHPGQALSQKDENAIVKMVWEKYIPHPMIRNTAGLPTASMNRNGMSDGDVRRVKGLLLPIQGLQVAEASLDDPGVSFAALSIMAGGDGSMMTGFFGNTEGNFHNMFDGINIDPEDMALVGDSINKEVKANWEHDYIGAVLDSLDMENPEFQEWAAEQKGSDGSTLLDELGFAEENLSRQKLNQAKMMKEINSRDHSVSHMAGAGDDSVAFFEGTPLNSTTLGTTTTDPLLDLAADDMGNMANGIRKMSAADVKKLLSDHTFENPVLSGLWKVLSPLINDNLTLFMSADKQALAEFYQQNERREMGPAVDGISIGDRVYIRAINAETMVHELLHATTKNLTATFFSQPGALTQQQREAMKNLVALRDQFLEMDTSEMAPHQQAMVEHVQAVMRGLDENSAMQEFLAYGLTNYHLQRTLGNTKSTIGKLAESVFSAVKALFGFPNGTQSDSMLAQMFSNFERLTEQATNVTYPVNVDEALEAVNPRLARSFSDVIKRLAMREATASSTLAAATAGTTRMQELADSNLFPTMTEDQINAGAFLQTVFSAGIQIKADVASLMVRVVDAVREKGADAWRTNNDPKDQADIDLAQARYEFFFENPSSRHDRVADILSMSLVNPEFSSYMEKIILPSKGIKTGSLDNILDSVAGVLYEKLDTGRAIKKDANLSQVMEVAGLRLRKSMLANVKRQQSKPGPARNAMDKLAEGVQYLGEKVGKMADARLKLKGNKDWIGSGLMITAGTMNDGYAELLGKATLHLSNQMEGNIPFRELVQEVVGTNADNYKLIKLKGIADRMISAIRQSFREQTPATVRSWFKDLTKEQDELLHQVIGKSALYTLSQDMKDRLEELLTDPSNAKLDAELVLMAGGNRTKRLLMIKNAKLLGDRMANKGNQALYMNTRAIAGLEMLGGPDVMTDKEMAALEDLSTLQALSHLTARERRQTLEIFRENQEGFWKTTVLIHSFFDFDTKRSGEDSASLNFQKGYIPAESDGRKKLKLVMRSEVKAAERMGWVVVKDGGKDKQFTDDANLVYMATTVGKTPTLSGGAIHAVDFHMNGVHYHSGMPTDPSIQTLITKPSKVKEIQDRILNGEAMPYSILYDGAGNMVGFQRQLDPALIDRHTKTVGRVSEAAGIWLGRIHEEQVAHGQNLAATKLLRDTWDQAKKDKRENQFINIRTGMPQGNPNGKPDKVLSNIWDTLPYHTKRQLEQSFADGSKNPPIWIRRDQLNDAIGYHKASVGNFFTGDNRFQEGVNTNVAALSRQILGKEAYKYLVTAETGWQALIGTAKDTIIVKSLTVALNNLISNQTQLMMITGNPIWNLRVQAQKHKELVSYLGYQQRVARLTAEGYATTDPQAKKKIDSEQTYLKNEIRKLSIWPLIEAGEMPSIAEGLSESEEFSMVGDLTAWIEKQTGKMPGVVGTIINNLSVNKETSIYKALDRMVQYGDFVAKAAMYEWLTTQDKAAKKDALEMMINDKSKTLTMEQALSEVAMREVNDEFVNYSRLPGRWRTYGEDMGLLWFYNYKLRMMKMGFRRIRKNPAAFLIASQTGGMLGIDTLVGTLPWNANFAYSTGIDPLFTAHQTVWWNQWFN